MNVCEVPIPKLAYRSCFGFSLASLIKSDTDWIGSAALTARTNGFDASITRGVKSRIGSYFGSL